ncbi:hypothetical protein SDC9_72108 [bioreactor metagenome]|uniref:Uncharacterized protein n=1 Tax=bioreactor metagenome TaxID=1076179 RepID=A0A644YCJ6_9ZZZZ
MIDVDLHAGFFDDAVDCISAFTNDDFDLIWFDLHHFDLRSILGQFFAWGCNRAGQLSKDFHPRFLRLHQRFSQDLFCDPLDFDVHLQRSDTFACSGNFEVHVAQVIFKSLDVRQNCIVFAFHH